MKRTISAALVSAAALVSPAAGQHADHAHEAMPAAGLPTQAGNAIFAALREVVEILEADPATDWSKVRLEPLRQHLIDMQTVIANADVKETEIPDGVMIDVTGTGRVADAIRRMTSAHARQPDLSPGVRVTVQEISGGSRLTITAADPRNRAKVRGLGFAGLMVGGGHHGPHHLALARGDHSH